MMITSSRVACAFVLCVLSTSSSSFKITCWRAKIKNEGAEGGEREREGGAGERENRTMGGARGSHLLLAPAVRPLTTHPFRKRAQWAGEGGGGGLLRYKVEIVSKSDHSWKYICRR